MSSSNESYTVSNDISNQQNVQNEVDQSDASDTQTQVQSMSNDFEFLNADDELETSSQVTEQVIQQEDFLTQTKYDKPQQTKSMFGNLFSWASSSSKPSIQQKQTPIIQQQQMPKPGKMKKAKVPLFAKKPVSVGFPRRILTENWDTKAPCAVIVTIYSESSYDEIFRTVAQQSPDPESSIAVFEMDYQTIPLYLQYVNSRGAVSERDMPQATIDAIKDIVDAIDQVEPEAVVFNFECCGHCSDSGFSTNGNDVIDLLKTNIDNGFMTMFGDFSVKALISSWNETFLGPNPFDRIHRSSCSSSMVLAFDSAKLLQCPSAQLQNVGKLHDGINTANLHCLGGTVVFSLKSDLKKRLSVSSEYELDVLTVATKIDGGHVHGGTLFIGDHTGHAGHVLLTYNNEKKGKILVSAGHWIELSQMGADTERVFSAMKEQYGEMYEQQLRTEYNSASSDSLRTELVQRNCKQLVQSSAPCAYKKKSLF